MEKTITITLASTNFQLSEASFEKLRHYLESLKAHFTDDRDEIMRDIESRIAEKFLESKHTVITERDVSVVIEEMGTAAEMDAGEEADANDAARKKFYRDTDNAIIAGVCSGIAAYFGIDVWIPRLLFLVSIFFGGTGILLYIILWVIIPEAKTASQKLEMHGIAVTLEGITRVVKERVEEASASGVLSKTISAVQSLVAGIFRVVGRFFGVIFIVGSFFGVIGALIGTGIIATNWNAPYNDFPLRGAVADPLLFAGLIAAFVATIIPLVFIFAFGLRLVRKKVTFPSIVGFGLFGIWALAIVVGAVIAVNVSGKYFEYTRTNPDYQTETRTLELAPFTKVSANNERVTIKSGSMQTVTLEGRALDMDTMSIDVRDGVLVITEKDDYGKLCIFCGDPSVDVVVTTPDLESVFIEGGAVWFDEYTDEKLYIEMFYGSVRGTLTIPVLDIKSDGGSFRTNLTSGALTINAEDTHFEMDGSITTATITLDQSSFYGDSLTVTNMTADIEDSFADLHVTGTLKLSEKDSRVSYDGDPEVTP